MRPVSNLGVKVVIFYIKIWKVIRITSAMCENAEKYFELAKITFTSWCFLTDPGSSETRITILDKATTRARIDEQNIINIENQKCSIRLVTN